MVRVAVPCYLEPRSLRGMKQRKGTYFVRVIVPLREDKALTTWVAERYAVGLNVCCEL